MAKTAADETIWLATTHSAEETGELAERLAPLLPEQGVVLALDGDLGAGKTAFTKGLARGLHLDSRQVSSPTFTLCQTYEGAPGTKALHHFDVYRLDGAEAFRAAGLDEYFDRGEVCLVEWAGQIKPCLPASAWYIEVRVEGRGELQAKETEAEPDWLNPSGLDLATADEAPRHWLLRLPAQAVSPEALQKAGWCMATKEGEV